jgi:hypothetical protein
VIVKPELKNTVKGTIDGFRKHLTILETMAQKELDGKPLSDDEYTEILDIGGTIEHFIILMGSLDSVKEDYPTKNPDPIRKIVDVQKDKKNEIRLYEALGYANEINVAVPFYGRRQLVKGPVYSYYEFTSPENLDSAAWRKIKNPVKPIWLKDLYLGKSTDSLNTLPDFK